MPNTPPTGSTPVDPTASSVEPDTGSTPIVPAEDASADGTTATLDNALLNSADGDPAVWGGELARFLVALGGPHIEPDSLTAIFGAYGQQVQANAYKRAALAVANYAIEGRGQSAQTLLAVMDFRADASALLLQTV